MKVLYTAPNRGHHFIYAEGLNNANLLFRFVTGVSRFNKYASVTKLSERLVRADFVQFFYLIGLKLKLPKSITDYLAYVAKVEQDNRCRSIIKTNSVDFFIFYSGSGLNTCKQLIKRSSKCLKIVEAVNSHVSFQENLLQNEYSNLGLTWRPFLKAEKRRRLLEYQLADFILLPSEFVRNSFIEMGFSPEKLLKVSYGFNNNIRMDFETKVSDKFTILYVGSISVRKGIRYLIEAFRLFKHPNKELIVVGPMANDGALESLTLPSNVIFTGVLKGEDLSKKYATATVFCLPSIEEGLALVIGEALSYGLPVIATVNTGAEDILEDGKEGFIVPIRSSEAISEKLQLLATDLDLYSKIKQSAANKAKTLLGWKDTQNNLVSVLQNIYDKGK